MSDEINDGGPAFPVPSYVNADGETWESKPQGMTLRDWFAGQALNALTVSEVLEAFRRNDYDGRQSHNVYLPCQTPGELASAAYAFADAMIAARGGQ